MYTEIQESVEEYGFAVITLHPQQFSILNEKSEVIGLNSTRVADFKDFVLMTKNSFHITTIAGLGGYAWKIEELPFRPNILMIAPIIFFPLILVAVVYYIKRRYAKIPRAHAF